MKSIIYAGALVLASIPSYVFASELPRRSQLSIMETSEILSNGSTWTIVPKGSLLHVPEYLKKNVLSKPQGELVDWQTFTSTNRSLVRAEEISYEQAKGNIAIAEDRQELFEMQRVIVVATNAGRPIEVKPLKQNTEDNNHQ
ncbi:hypothetical protein [Persicirhabdus sediminis]|uniref:Uncharacterized protein n=1 Tax=Persicirhabdus sediminis TaxID=454144 RepID=A0A8J7SI02_9BACT|nr:hypothetical protein [Persicirhabdus sediminis]MBK1790121.1 hypothetical protein [Persicirhabdus sediminis]